MLKIASFESESGVAVAPAEDNAMSMTVSATVSTGSQRGDSSSLGRTPIVVADWSIRGMASVAFQMPCCVSPITWPIRSTRAWMPVCWVAETQRCSPTSFDRA